MRPTVAASAFALLAFLAACSPPASTTDATVGTDATSDTVSTAQDAAPADAAVASTPTPAVDTTLGPVIGRAGSDGVTRYLGIPYAAPPVGALRFRYAQQHDPWTIPFDASRNGYACPQSTTVAPAATQREDCLFLHVWAPADASPATPKPVMVFLHGGAFLIGSGTQATYDGTNFARHGVVLVTVNYRLGHLGYLADPALADEDPNHATGNYGVSDQLLALRWVHDNIAAFGGDPSQVTLFGESAGAISVCTILHAPLARGLFRRAMIESGTCNGRLVPVFHDRAIAERHARALRASVGCATALDVPACLRALPAERLVPTGALIDLSATAEDALVAVPTVDGTIIPVHPAAWPDPATLPDVELVLGFNHDEFTLFTRFLSNPPFSIPDAATYATVSRRVFGAFGDRMLALYPPTSHGTPLQTAERALRDAAFACPTRALARTFARAGRRVRLYHFTYAPGFFALSGLGSTHSAELNLVFGNFVAPITSPNATDRALSATLLDAWTRFARTGDPTGGGIAMWPAFTTNAPAYLDLGTSTALGDNEPFAQCDALDAIETELGTR